MIWRPEIAFKISLLPGDRSTMELEDVPVQGCLCDKHLENPLNRLGSEPYRSIVWVL